MLDRMRHPNFDADKGGAGSAGQDGAGDGDQDDQNLTFDGWLAKQPEQVKGLLDGHTKGLKNALESERESRKKLEKDLRELAGKADAGSEAQKQLTHMADQITESDRRADFYESAHAAGVTNLKLAYMVATSDNLFDRKGNPDLEALKTSYPELFGGRTKAPAGNAGSGTGDNKKPSRTMNDYIRAASGRKL
jgi:hypothetical protein